MVVFHVYDEKTELNFNFDNTPRKFIDVETGKKSIYFRKHTRIVSKVVQEYFKTIEATCMQYQIRYVPVSVGENFKKFYLHLIEKQKFGKTLKSLIFCKNICRNEKA